MHVHSFVFILLTYLSSRIYEDFVTVHVGRGLVRSTPRLQRRWCTRACLTTECLDSSPKGHLP